MTNEIPPGALAGTGETAKKQPAFRLGYVRSLDGLRGVAILLVLITHVELAPVMYGFVGVDIFFVLSGFLITCLLIEEWDQTNRISLRAFYARRALRLLPALVVMLVAFVIYSHFFHDRRMQRLEQKEALLALFYSTNWAAALGLSWSSFLGHTWSLSIEEQFYLIWPVLLLLLLRRTSRNSLLCFVMLGIVLVLLDRFLLFSGTAATILRLERGLDTRADSLLIGCAIGVVISSGLLPRPPWLRPALRVGSAISFAALGFTCAMLYPRGAGMYYAGWLLISIFSGIILLELIAAPGGVFPWVLGLAPLVWVGRISYGLYVWHFPLIQVLKETRLQPPQKYRALYLVLSFAAATASYYLVELPFLRLKRRFQKAK